MAAARLLACLGFFFFHYLTAAFPDLSFLLSLHMALKFSFGMLLLAAPSSKVY